ncbi:MAG TPA: hypothetical protein VGR76_03605 [Candidatus Angelobacter sp.]|jgi:hypothetical protein|nr:hypothetical protein [Candidatus Angelobacter sp.]
MAAPWEAYQETGPWSQFSAPDIGPEIAGGVTDALKSAASSVGDYLNPFSEARHASYANQAAAPLGEALKQNLSQIAGTGQALATPLTAPAEAAGAVLTPPVAHGFQALNQAAGIDLPYEKAKEQAGTALEGLAPRRFSPMGARPGTAPPTPAPTVDDLAAAKTADYNHPAVTELRIKPQAAEDFSKGVDKELLANKVDRFVAPTVSGIVDRLETPRFGPSHTVADFDLARQSLKDVPYNEGRAAKIVSEAIDNYLPNIPQADLLAGNAAKASEFLTRARANAAAEFRARDIDSALHNAEVQAGSTYSGGNLNNATRQQLRPLLKVRRGATNFNLPGWTAAEMAQLRNAVIGTPTGNIARGIGKMGPNGGLMGLGHVEAAFKTGGASLPFSAVTALAKTIGNRSTANQAAILSELLRSRSPLAQAAPPARTPSPNPLLSGLLQNILGLGMRPMQPAYADENK